MNSMELTTKEDKIKYLKSNGWHTLWHDNNWVNPIIMAGANLDWCGVDIDSAIKIQNKKNG